MVFGTEYTLTESEKGALDEVRRIGRGRLGPLFDVESASIQTIYQRTLNEAADAVARTTVPFTATLVASGLNLLVGSTSLTNIYDFLAAYRDRTEDLDRLYEKNVRRFLGSRGKVNRGMRDTLKSAPGSYLMQSGKNYLRDAGAYKDPFYLDLAMRAIRALDTSPRVPA